jgi:chromosome segregation ATPase
MGVERAVTRWYIRCQEIQREIDSLLAQLNLPQPEVSPAEDRADLERQLASAQLRLRELGPCPRSMMG